MALRVSNLLLGKVKQASGVRKESAAGRAAAF